MAVRNMYTFFWVERALMRSDDTETKMEIAQKIGVSTIHKFPARILTNIWYIGSVEQPIWQIVEA